MKTTTITSKKLINLLALLALLCIFLIALKFVIGIIRYFSYNEQALTSFWSVRWWLYGHIAGGILALIIGPFQFWSFLRKKFSAFHHWTGRVYVIAILLSSICSCYLAWTHALAVHWTWAFSLQIMAVAWILTTFVAFKEIRAKRVQNHKDWIIRSYLVTFAFVSFRWLVELPFLVDLGNFIERAPTAIWASWTIPLLVFEIILLFKSTKRGKI